MRDWRGDVRNELEVLLTELECFGSENDQMHADRPKRMLNITHDTGEFLSVLVTATNAKKILEIGTSNGYSTLWLADAAQKTGGVVTTVEYSDYKVVLAAKNFARAGLDGVIIQKHADAESILSGMDDRSVDLLFLDSERSEYVGWWHQLKRVLKIGGLLVVDNAMSHAAEMAPFMALVADDAEFSTSLVPVGNGEFLAVRH